MENTNSLDRKFETIAWGALLIWWGLRWWPLISLPNGMGLLGSGLILLGLSAIRSLNGIPVKGFTTLLGILGLLFGGMFVARDVFQLSFELPLFEMSLIVMGMILLARELLRVGKKSTGESR